MHAGAASVHVLVKEDERGGLLLVDQDDHAHLAGELAAALADGLPAPRGALVAAARVHDNGWREADAAPTLDVESGRPHAYTDVPDDVYLDVWRRGIDRAVALDPYVGLLVSLHGLRFFSRRTRPPMQEFVAQRRAQQDELLAQLGATGASWRELPDDVRAHHEWLRWLDSLSLFLLGDWGDELELTAAARRHRVRRVDEQTVAMEPFPFAAPLEFRVPALRLPRRRCESEAALQDEVRSARKAQRSPFVCRLVQG